jgi:hypothetical protein
MNIAVLSVVAEEAYDGGKKDSEGGCPHHLAPRNKTKRGSFAIQRVGFDARGNRSPLGVLRFRAGGKLLFGEAIRGKCDPQRSRSQEESAA